MEALTSTNTRLPSTPQQPPRQPSPAKGPEPEPQPTEPLPPYTTSTPPKPALSDLGIRLEHISAEISYRQTLEIQAVQQQRPERDLEQGRSRGAYPPQRWYQDRPGMVCYGMFALITLGSIAAICVYSATKWGDGYGQW